MARKLFEKGKSGNPGGRPKQPYSLTELAQAHCQDALQVLIDALKSSNEKHRIMAANILLDRGYGKPVQEITGQLNHTITEMPTIEKGNRLLEYNIGNN